MNEDMKEHFEAIVKGKARIMMGNPEWKSHAAIVLEKLLEKDPQKAFVVGAIDAMIFDMAAAINIKISREDRRRIIEEIYNQ